MDEPVLIEEKKNAAAWREKARIYFLIGESVFSVIGALMLANGGNAGWLGFGGGLLYAGVLGAIPVVLISIGFALPGTEKNNSKNAISIVLIVLGFLAFIPGCAIMMLFTFISA